MRKRQKSSQNCQKRAREVEISQRPKPGMLKSQNKLKNDPLKFGEMT